jgi:hypothetical protein
MFHIAKGACGLKIVDNVDVDIRRNWGLILGNIVHFSRILPRVFLEVPFWNSTEYGILYAINFV